MNDLERHSRTLFEDSVANIDMPMRSRLTRARHAALEAAAVAHRRPWLFRTPVWTSAAGVTAMAVLGAALWLGSPLASHQADVPANLEDLDIVAAADNSGDTLDMLQDDLDFYEFADKAAALDSAA